MEGLVEGYASKLGWQVCQCNVLVEGTSDVRLLWLANALYYERHHIALLGNRFSVLAAGVGNEGGVDGLNRRLNAVKQIADADRAADGSLRYRFIGLYDNDHAGRCAIESACTFDRRLRPYADLFLLHPVMSLASGADHATLHRKFDSENASYRGLDWEIEDLLSESLLLKFEDKDPNAVIGDVVVGGRKHREFTREGKRALVEFVSRHAKIEDVVEIIKLIRALHDYHRLPISHIEC